MFHEEKVRNEIAVIRYIQKNTSIPVPFILHWRTKNESPLGPGPFILMEYIDHATDLSTASLTLGGGDRPILDPSINIDKPVSIIQDEDFNACTGADVAVSNFLYSMPMASFFFLLFNAVSIAGAFRL